MGILADHVNRACDVLSRGGLVLLPTDIGYGLIATSDEAVARIYELKGRPRAKPCIAVGNAAILADVATLRDERLRMWIGQVAHRTPIAVVNRIREGSKLLEALSPYMLTQVTAAGTIATFHSAGLLVTSIAERLHAEGRLLAGSSANVSFTGNNYVLADVPDSIRSRVDLEIDGGRVRYHNADRLATTILDLNSYAFLRIGVNHSLIEEAWREFQLESAGYPAEEQLLLANG